jgi:hypothetical protein
MDTGAKRSGLERVESTPKEIQDIGHAQVSVGSRLIFEHGESLFKPHEAGVTISAFSTACRWRFVGLFGTQFRNAFRDPSVAARSLLLLQTSTVRSYRLGHAKYGRKYFEDDSTVEDPEKIPDQGGEQREQSLHWGPLERQHDPGNPGDKSHEQV